MADVGKEAELANVMEDIAGVRRDLKDLRGERDEERKKAEADQDKERLKEIKSEIREKEALLTELLKEKRSLEGAAVGGAPAAGTCCTHPPSCLSFHHLKRIVEQQCVKGIVCVQGWDNLT
jgi:hypothetical protein